MRIFQDLHSSICIVNSQHQILKAQFSPLLFIAKISVPVISIYMYKVLKTFVEDSSNARLRPLF